MEEVEPHPDNASAGGDCGSSLVLVTELPLSLHRNNTAGNSTLGGTVTDGNRTVEEGKSASSPVAQTPDRITVSTRDFTPQSFSPSRLLEGLTIFAVGDDDDIDDESLRTDSSDEEDYGTETDTDMDDSVVDVESQVAPSLLDNVNEVNALRTSEGQVDPEQEIEVDHVGGVRAPNRLEDNVDSEQEIEVDNIAGVRALDVSEDQVDSEEDVEFTLEDSKHVLQKPSAKAILKNEVLRPRGTKRFWCIIVLVIALIVALIVTTIVLARRKSGDDSRTTTGVDSVPFEPIDPTSPAFLEVASRIFSDESLYPTDPDSSDYKAIQFLLEENGPMPLTIEDYRVPQRFALASIYFALGGESWENSLTFLSDRHECDWRAVDPNDGLLKGVVCATEGDNPRVTYLSLPGNNLVGTIPSTISRLSDLFHLDLSYNKVQGSIPAQLSEAIGLERLLLQVNEMTGPIPNFSNSWPSLDRFHVQHNQLTGNLTPLCPTGASMHADCSGKFPLVFCPCCSMCCDDTTGTCT